MSGCCENAHFLPPRLYLSISYIILPGDVKLIDKMYNISYIDKGEQHDLSKLMIIII